MMHPIQTSLLHHHSLGQFQFLQRPFVPILHHHRRLQRALPKPLHVFFLKSISQTRLKAQRLAQPLHPLVLNWNRTLRVPYQQSHEHERQINLIGTQNPRFFIHFKPKLGDFPFKKSQSSDFIIKGVTPKSKSNRGKLDDDVLVEVAEKGLFYRKRIGVLPKTGETGGVLCAPDLGNVGSHGYSLEITASYRRDSVFIDDVMVVVVGAESFAEEEGHFVRRVCGLRRRRSMEEELLRRETDGGGMG
ncbi:hypothetical protein RHMOL_Rhmol02G0125000 [Rhododendron molle]|uniref:Uncharacterized protein n=1 Tax=Rhododendron molle TaxID=49168 RepID=A0ACC0PPF8_RHOML|nr:hypothetical protein RHMOL_Rhmol02G0125000 [Rhododendron molle]